MARFLLTAVGPDGYGIVARVTAALSELDCNLADSTMSNLSGYFAIMLVVDAADDVTEKQIYTSVQSRCSELSLMVDVQGVSSSEVPGIDGDRYVVSVYGTDRPGIVSGICDALASMKANIVDLTTRVIETDDLPVYTMILEVSIDDSVSPDDLRDVLSAKSELLGVACSIRPVDSEEL